MYTTRNDKYLPNLNMYYTKAYLQFAKVPNYITYVSTLTYVEHFIFYQIQEIVSSYVYAIFLLLHIFVYLSTSYLTKYERNLIMLVIEEAKYSTYSLF